MTYIHNDKLNFLNYWAQLPGGIYRTANLRNIYNRYQNTSNLNSLWVHVYLDYLNYWCHSHRGSSRFIKFINTHDDFVSWKYIKFMEYLIADDNSFSNLDPDLNSDCDVAKTCIRDILKKYDQLFIDVSYPVQIKNLNFIPKQPVPYAEKYKLISYQKGHRGAISTFGYHWYI